MHIISRSISRSTHQIVTSQLRRVRFPKRRTEAIYKTEGTTAWHWASMSPSARDLLHVVIYMAQGSGVKGIIWFIYTNPYKIDRWLKKTQSMD